MQFTDPVAPAPVVGAPEFKRAVHVGGEADDDLIAGLLMAAQGVVETAAAQMLSPREMTFMVDEVDWREWWFPVRPVNALVSVSYIQPDEESASIDPGDLLVRNTHDEPRLIVRTGFAWPARAAGSAIRVTANVGHGTPCPTLKQAIILIAKEWYDVGIDIGDAPQHSYAFGARALISQNRYRRPCVLSPQSVY